MKASKGNMVGFNFEDQAMNVLLHLRFSFIVRFLLDKASHPAVSTPESTGDKELTPVAKMSFRPAKSQNKLEADFA